MNKVYIKNHNFGAGKWIYKGYESAWKKKGYTTVLYDRLEEIDTSSKYDLITLDGMINSNNIDYVKKANRCYLYTQPNSFPQPWGSHPNFFCICDDETIFRLNNMDNVFQWCFGKITDYHHKWRNVNYVPLAFDSLNYNFNKDSEYKFDVCFIGGWANNGFNEKKQIMIDHFKKFKDSNFKCGIFINREISHDVETRILSNSKISLNIHDAYQRKLGLDTNERTFKSLGLCGYLISDQVEELNNLFPNIKTSSDPDEFIDLVYQALETRDDELNFIKKQNKLDIMNNHTYINRVEYLLQL